MRSNGLCVSCRTYRLENSATVPSCTLQRALRALRLEQSIESQPGLDPSSGEMLLCVVRSNRSRSMNGIDLACPVRLRGRRLPLRGRQYRRHRELCCSPWLLMLQEHIETAIYLLLNVSDNMHTFCRGMRPSAQYVPCYAKPENAHWSCYT
jgi:hypothetical protein